MTKKIVCKFGGSSVADATQFQKIKAIVTADKKRRVIVVSAPGKRNSKETKLTDLLYSTYDLASKGLDFSTPWTLIRERYLGICTDLGIKTHVTNDLDALEKNGAVIFSIGSSQYPERRWVEIQVSNNNQPKRVLYADEDGYHLIRHAHFNPKAATAIRKRYEEGRKK